MTGVTIKAIELDEKSETSRSSTAMILICVLLSLTIVWGSFAPAHQASSVLHPIHDATGLLPPSELGGTLSGPAHYWAYAALTIALVLTQVASPFRSFLAAMVFGILIEVLQPLFGRGFNPTDLIDNAEGGTIGLVLAWALLRTFSLVKSRTSPET